jgi:leader peptidase (prepilin peptidase)/N-methyltransferase
MEAPALTPSSPPAARLSGRRTTVTAAAALVGVACFVKFGVSRDAFVGAVFGAVLVVLSATDLERRIIPNKIVLPATGFVFVAHSVFEPSRLPEWAIASAAAFVGFLALALIYPGGLGMGDVKLALLLGAGLGWSVLTALIAGTVFAGVFGVFLLVIRGRAGTKATFPFGPFLAAGALLVLFLS